MNNEFAKQVWADLNAFDCSPMVEKKGRLNYLSWANAWTTLMSLYPASTFAFNGDLVQPDGSIEVSVTVAVTEGDDHITRTITLPVMDNRNDAVLAPNAREISDTRMRCLTKCIALFGLGLFLYRGEDIPKDTKPPAKMPTDAQYAKIQELHKGIGGTLPIRRGKWLNLDKPEIADLPDSNWNKMTAEQAKTIIKESE